MTTKTTQSQFAREAAEIAEQMLDVTVEARLPESQQFAQYLARREAARRAAQARFAPKTTEAARAMRVIAAFSR